MISMIGKEVLKTEPITGSEVEKIIEEKFYYDITSIISKIGL